MHTSLGTSLDCFLYILTVTSEGKLQKTTDSSPHLSSPTLQSLCVCAGTLPWRQYFLQGLLVEWGEDQLVVVDKATEANSKLF